MRKNLRLLLLMPALVLLLNGCVVVKGPKIHVPPGQIKKQTAPGQMKKH